MTAKGIGVKMNSALPLSEDDEKQLWDSGADGLHMSKALSYGVFFYDCKMFGLRVMNEHVKDSLGEIHGLYRSSEQECARCATAVQKW